MGCRCLCLCCRCCCRGCISKWCDQINDRLAPKALKKFSSCFLFFVFHSRIDSAPLFSQEIFLARTAAAASAVTIETVSVASQRAAGPGDGPQTDSQTVYLSKYLSIVCGVKKVHILLGRERKKKIRALNANTCGVELSFFLQPQVACGASYKSLSSNKKLQERKSKSISIVSRGGWESSAPVWTETHLFLWCS